MKGHGRPLTRLLFFSFRRTTRKNLELLPAALKAKLVTSAGEQYRQARSKAKDQPFFSLGLSEEFFWACRFSEAFPPDNGSFRAGMKTRLAGFGDERETPAQWDEVYRDVPHGVWLLAHARKSGLDRMQRAVEKLLKQHHARLRRVHTQRSRKTVAEDGRRWSDDPEGKILREPFGFRDGLSQMNFFAAASKTPDFVRIGLDQVLIPDSNHAGGSFLVLRKLDQNVKAFRAFEASMGETFRRDGKWCPARTPGALLVGRERDGTPLVKGARGAGNNFDFDGDPLAAVCPFHAHIRKANPRTTAPTAADAIPPHRDAQFVRRSVVYDERGQLPERSSADYPEGAKITGDTGLLFMGYMRDIRLQFERMNRDWFNNVDFPFTGTGMGDPIIRGPTGARSSWNWNGLEVRGLTSFVRSRGGAYFYVPSMEWLRNPMP